MTDIDSDTFVKSILGAMWMLNDLPKNMRKNLDNQMGIIWLLISDSKCFPTIAFTASQQEAICNALASCNGSQNKREDEEEEVFKYTYEKLLQNPHLKQKK